MYFGRCNLTTCRYNVEHYCTDRKHRNECLSVKRNKAYSLIKGNKEVLDNVIDEGEKIWQVQTK